MRYTNHFDNNEVKSKNRRIRVEKKDALLLDCQHQMIDNPTILFVLIVFFLLYIFFLFLSSYSPVFSFFLLLINILLSWFYSIDDSTWLLYRRPSPIFSSSNPNIRWEKEKVTERKKSYQNIPFLNHQYEG
jgi:hypothetical protein